MNDDFDILKIQPEELYEEDVDLSEEQDILIDLSKPEVYNKIMAAIEKLTPEEVKKHFKDRGYDVIFTERKDHDDFHCSTKHEDLDDE